ncbi:hypothetical protein [Flavobacterium koreense]
MSVTNPFPLNITLKVDSPQLLAFLAQFGESKFASASDFNKIFQALDYLYENMGSGGSALFLGDFVSVEALQAEHPSPVAGNTANIIVEGGSNDLAVWDNDDSQWIIYPGAGYSFSIPTFQEITEQGASSDKDVQVNTLTQPFQASLLDAVAGSVRYITQDNKVIFLWSTGQKVELWLDGRIGDGTKTLGVPRISGQAAIKKTFAVLGSGTYDISQDDTDRILVCNLPLELIFTSTSLSSGREFEIYVPSTNSSAVTLNPSGASVIGYSSGIITLSKGFYYRLYRQAGSFHLTKVPEAATYIPTSTDLALKANNTLSSTGVSITFDTPKIYNLPSAPATANITNDLTGAKIGVVQKIYHNNSSAPTFPGGWVNIGGTYTNSVLNIIFAEWVEGSRVEYWIVKG